MDPVPDDARPEEARKEFQSYLFFLRHFAQLILVGGAPELGVELIRRLVQDQNPLVANVARQQLTAQEIQTLRKYLFTSWNSECVARLSTMFDEQIRRFTNQWKPVQCYYAVYFLLVAVQYAVTRKVGKKHGPTIRIATNSVHWFPVPWRLRLDYDNKVLHEFPAGTVMWGDSGWNLRNNEPYFHVANFLRRTGRRTQEETAREYRRRRVKIPAGRPRAGKLYRIADVSVGFVSVFDVFWRFRRWANYHEGDTIIEGAEYRDHAVEFDGRFNLITETTAAVLENVLCRCVGRGTLRPLYDEFLGLAGGGVDVTSVARRRDVVCPPGA